MDYFESLWVDGKWDTLVSYLSGFVKTDKPHNHSVLYFEIIKQKFLEALDKYVLPPTLCLLLGMTKYWPPGS
jgi:hypothetical protein